MSSTDQALYIYGTDYYETSEEAVSFAKYTAANNGFVLIIRNSTVNGRVILCCNRAGKNTTNNPNARVDRTGCPYCVTVMPITNRGKKLFFISVTQWTHNHPVESGSNNTIMSPQSSSQVVSYATTPAYLPSFPHTPFQQNVDIQQTLHQIVNAFVSALSPKPTFAPCPQTFPYGINTVMPNIAT